MAIPKEITILDKHYLSEPEEKTWGCNGCVFSGDMPGCLAVHDLFGLGCCTENKTIFKEVNNERTTD